MVLTKCCWCVDLEIGALIIAWFDFFYSIVSFITNIIYLNSEGDMPKEIIFIKTANDTDEVLDAINRNPGQDIRASHLAMNVLMLIVATGLLYGMIQKSYRFVIGWLIVNVLAIIFLGLAIIASIFLLFEYGASIMFGVTLFITFEFAIKMYIFSVIYSQFKLIYNESHGISVVSYKPAHPLQGTTVVEYGAVNPPAYNVPQYN